jgi:hypothetical protein
MQNFKATKYALLAALPALILGCASAYSLSERGVKFRGSLTEAQAFKELRNYAFKSSAQAGVCGAHTNDQFQPAAPVAVQAPYLVFDSYVRVMTGVSSAPGAAAGTVATTMSYTYVKAPFKMDVTKLDKIRVQPEVKALCGRYVEPLSDYVVTIDNKGVADSAKGEANALMINVSKDNLEYLLAVLSYLSPGAKILEGTGL